MCLFLGLCTGWGKPAPPILWLLGTNPPWLLGILFTSALNSLQVRKYKSMILEDLESALAEHAPAPQEVNSELPPLTIDGIPVSVDKMTQVRGGKWGGETETSGNGVGGLQITLFSFILSDTTRVRCRLESYSETVAALEKKM